MRNTTKYFLILLAALAVLLLLGVIGKPAEGFSGGAGVDSFTMYYADWCPHCQSVKPAFKSWSSSGSTKVGGKTVFLSMVEADANPDKLKGKPVKGYPTFLLETADGKFKEFDGDRTPAGWTEWLTKNLA
jgi:thiol-disulfide isomerase/thioredoxin